MRKHPLALLVGMLVLCAAHAQERSFGTLPLAQKTKTSSLSGGRLADSSGYRKALNVYNKLVQARGDFRFPVPAFLMTREENRVAGINYDQLEIVLEEKAYKVCATYGAQSDAAMAFLLGHELTHYYEKHAWRRGFAADYRDLPIGLKLDSLLDGAANETEADYLGGFLAYSAGYGLFDKGADLMQSSTPPMAFRLNCQATRPSATARRWANGRLKNSSAWWNFLIWPTC
ncbi:MAG: hypothetical protein IPH16_14130 [Haliscomenobacter sp.]|nr:hypothetical protein [Haliscomenobacter sp.]